MKYQRLDHVKKWFGFTRRERRASFALLVLIVAVAFARYLGRVRDEEPQLFAVTDPASNAASMSKMPINVIKAGIPAAGNLKEPGMIELNECDSAALEALPGIGPVLAVRILKYRNLLGGYSAVAQLHEVYGLPEETYRLISGRLTADTSKIKKININTADYKRLIRMPYFEKNEVEAILRYRKENGRIDGIKEIIDNKLITEENVKKLKPYLRF